MKLSRVKCATVWGDLHAISAGNNIMRLGHEAELE